LLRGARSDAQLGLARAATPDNGRTPQLNRAERRRVRATLQLKHVLHMLAREPGYS